MNESTNGTSSFDIKPTMSEIIEMFYQISFFIIGTPINIYALIKTTKHIREGGVESRLVKLSRHLLIAHLMVLFMYGAWRSYWFYNTIWLHGDIMCKIFSFLCALPFHLWSNLVAAIAVDMLFCITSPLNSYRTGSNRVSWLIITSWTFAIICALPMAFIRGTVEIYSTETQKLEQCYPRLDDFSHETIVAFNFFHVTTTFYIPLTIVIICYSIIGLSLRKQMEERKLLQDCGKKRKHRSTKSRFLKATLAIIATFFFTWLPYQILALLRVVCDDAGACSEITNRLNWLQALIIASTCINPFLYQFGKEKKSASQMCSTVDSGAVVRGIATRSSERRFLPTDTLLDKKRHRGSFDRHSPVTTI